MACALLHRGTNAGKLNHSSVMGETVGGGEGLRAAISGVRQHGSHWR